MHFAWSAIPLVLIASAADTLHRDTGQLAAPLIGDTICYETHIRPLLRSNCAKPGCHDDGSHKGGVNLTTYANILRTVEIEEEHGEVENEMEKKIRKYKMPPPSEKPLEPEQRALILAWIAQGMPNGSCSEMRGTPTVDSLDIPTFMDDIGPIVAANCLGCHSGSKPSNGYDFSDPAFFRSIAATGKVVRAISHQEGVTPMPFMEEKLPQATIDRMARWVEAGMP